MCLSVSHAFMISCISRAVEHSCFCEKSKKKFHVFMEFHVFVFWNHGLYVSRYLMHKVGVLEPWAVRESHRNII
jgi:hypothetical protein